MTIKADILERIGERGLLLPQLINQGLAANDRLKYYFTLLQTAYAYVRTPGGHVPDLRNEREAAGISDESLDQVVGASQMVSGGSVHIPGAALILDRVLLDVRRMLDPVATSAGMHGELAERSAIYARRLDEQVARVPPCTGDQINGSVLESLTRLHGQRTRHPAPAGHGPALGTESAAGHRFDRTTRRRARVRPDRCRSSPRTRIHDGCA
jgi:hypothetical protein